MSNTIRVAASSPAGRNDGSREWLYTIHTESGPTHSGTFHAGSAVIPDSPTELKRAILESTVHDILLVLNDAESKTHRSTVIMLVEDLGMEVRSAFDAADQLVSVVEWFDNLRAGEQAELMNYSEDQ